MLPARAREAPWEMEMRRGEERPLFAAASTSSPPPFRVKGRCGNGQRTEREGERHTQEREKVFLVLSERGRYKARAIFLVCENPSFDGIPFPSPEGADGTKVEGASREGKESEMPRKWKAKEGVPGLVGSAVSILLTSPSG